MQNKAKSILDWLIKNGYEEDLNLTTVNYIKSAKVQGYITVNPKELQGFDKIGEDLLVEIAKCLLSDMFEFGESRKTGDEIKIPTISKELSPEQERLILLKEQDAMVYSLEKRLSSPSKNR